MVGPLRKDGQPDMRFKCNSESTKGSLHSPNICGNDLNPPGPLRKDGQPDMRYAANKEWVARQNVRVQAPGPLRKDGQPNMCYAANREWVAQQNVRVQAPGPLQKDGQPDKHFAAKQNVRVQAPGPLRKDGHPDMRFAVNKKWVAEREAEKNVVANKEQVMNADVENVKFGLVNSRSLLSKLEELDDEIAKSKLDIVAVTETHFEDDSHLKEACPNGFKGVHEPRGDGRRGGGVAIFYREDDIKLTRHSLVDYKSFEYIDVSLDIGSGKKIRLLNIYRPPGNSRLKFLEEFETLLRASMRGKGKLLITGDFNLHVDIPDSDNYVRDFLKLIKSRGLVQHIKTATHEKGRILDLIITRASDSLVKNVRVDKEFFSDHKFIKCTLLVEKEEIFEREE